MSEEPRFRDIENLSFKMLRCKQCAKSVRIPRHRWESFRFCSRQCNWQWHTENDRISINCHVCGIQFSAVRSRREAKYCSRKCYGKSLHHRGSVDRQCVNCATIFRTAPSKIRHRFCSRNCVWEYRRARWTMGSGHQIRKFMLARGLIERCNRCGYKEEPRILGVHHKDRNRKNNVIENLEVLCPNCHSLEHLRHTVI